MRLKKDDRLYCSDCGKDFPLESALCGNCFTPHGCTQNFDVFAFYPSVADEIYRLLKEEMYPLIYPPLTEDRLKECNPMLKVYLENQTISSPV